MQVGAQRRTLTCSSIVINMTTENVDQNETQLSCCGGATSWLPTDDAEQLAHQLAALADPVRLQVLSIIANSTSGEVCACDFVGPIERSQPTISHHLKVLTDAGLVAGDKRGRWVWYRLAPGGLDGLVGTLSAATRRDDRQGTPVAGA